MQNISSIRRQSNAAVHGLKWAVAIEIARLARMGCPKSLQFPTAVALITGRYVR